ncbi:hypothetical protein BDQ12DRAFT_744678 [Crucibulum laeve]|uniref:Uncharacterized protein n=1 Tax=Crucibulum laeve TaxID=68775 RepID=A0A5C3M4J8_9AGAR|nr:hypothetical protein BDQ12DRAFT_744678 [Crucibulum laeve]
MFHAMAYGFSVLPVSYYSVQWGEYWSHPILHRRRYKTHFYILCLSSIVLCHLYIHNNFFETVVNFILRWQY